MTILTYVILVAAVRWSGSPSMNSTLPIELGTTYRSAKSRNSLVLRSRNEQAFGVLDQQLCAARSNDRLPL
jgi:hypothetical protein